MHTHHLLFHSLHNALGFLNIALYHHRVSLWNILAAEVKLKERERGREAVKEGGGGGGVIKGGERRRKEGKREGQKEKRSKRGHRR